MRTIEWIGDWLKQIILLVLVATFLDMILPSNALEKYVKLVMGLLIILAILSPIFKLLSEQLDLSSLAFFKDKTVTSIGTPSMLSLGEIEEQSNKLKEKQTEMVQKNTEQAMETWLTQNLPKRFSVEVVSANVTANFQSQMPEIKHISVVAREAAKGSGTSDIQPISEVETLSQIDSSTSTQEDPTTIKIKKLILETWNLSDEQVEVTLESR